MAKDDYSKLIGMNVRHKKFGAGAISSVSNKQGTLYFVANFIYYPNLMEFRVDLLDGWGGFFTDISQSIRAHGMAFPPVTRSASRFAGDEEYNSEDFRYESEEYRELLIEAESDNWEHYYNEETGWYEP